MASFELIENRLDVVLNTTAAGTGDTLSSSIVDMSGFDYVEFLVLLGDCADTATLTVRVQQNTENSATGMATLAGALVLPAFTATSGDNGLIRIAVSKPSKRFLRCQLLRGVANVAVGGVVARRSGSRTAPAGTGTQVIGNVVLYSPAEA